MSELQGLSPESLSSQFWTELYAALNQGERGRRILESISKRQNDAGRTLAAWLNDPETRDSLPPQVRNVVGGDVEQLVNIAQPQLVIIEERRSRENLRELSLLPLGSEDTLPLVSSLDPYQVDITPALYKSMPGGAPYVSRGIDSAIDQCLAETSLLLLVGRSKAGKSRSAFEAVARNYSNWSFSWVKPERLQQFWTLDSRIAEGQRRSLVVWLDDIQNYLLTPGGLDLQLLKFFNTRTPRSVIVATITYERFEALSGGQDEIGRNARQTLRELELSTIKLPTKLTPAELRLANEAYPSEDFSGGVSVGERLAAAPELLKRYNGRAVHSGWALVRSAIDWQRAGRTDPITEEVLRRLYPVYLVAEYPAEDPSDKAYAKGLRWAREPVASKLSLLSSIITSEGRGFRPFDYIVDAVSASEDEGDPATEIWEQAGAGATPEQLVRIGREAFGLGAIEQARLVWHKAVINESPLSAVAAANLGTLFIGLDDLEQAVRFLTLAANSANRDAAPRARVNLGLVSFMEERFEEAADHFAAVIADEHEEESPRAALALGFLLHALGDDSAAAEVLDPLVELNHPVWSQNALILKKISPGRAAEIAAFTADAKLVVMPNLPEETVAKLGVGVVSTQALEKLQDAMQLFENQEFDHVRTVLRPLLGSAAKEELARAKFLDSAAAYELGAVDDALSALEEIAGLQAGLWSLMASALHSGLRAWELDEMHVLDSIMSESIVELTAVPRMAEPSTDPPSSPTQGAATA